MNNNLTFQINIFQSVFKGRDDIFAIRWEKGKKSGYMPAYSYDPYMYRLHKMQGGTFKNYSDKSLLPLTNEQIAKHLKGEQLVGIYPLLKDNTSWFLAADFDKENWIDECRIFIKSCNDNGIPAYLERSRSGKGGHVWIFFEKPYPAIKSRKLFISILEKLGAFSIFDKSSSFDRLFPNQNYLSGKGFGNLIALPLYKHTWEKGNSCFIDSNTLQPYQEQWDFIKGIKKISVSRLDELCEQLAGSQNVEQNFSEKTNSPSSKLTIRLNNNIQISRYGLTAPLINYLKEKLNFYNTAYIVKKKLNKNVKDIERYFNFIIETESSVVIPRGMTRDLLNFCKKHKIDFDFKDERHKLKPVSFFCDIELRDHQKVTLEATYIWHKKKELLQSHLQDIDKDLNLIRNKGRQTFLESQPKKFSRILHDYSDDRKGLVIWKDNIGERLV